MALDKYRITNWFPVMYRPGETAKCIRFDVTLLDEKGPAWDMTGFLVNGKGQVTVPTAYQARSTRKLNLIIPREDHLEELERAWQTHPVLREELSHLFGFQEDMADSGEEKVVTFGGDDES